jgi:sugar O-acyltransferase (sialic acid O-acetyltransferase NeuD family)
MNKIAIIGFGALGQQILNLLSPAPSGDDVIVFDDTQHARGWPNALPFDAFLDRRFEHFSFYVGLGYLRLGVKTDVYNRLEAAGRRLPSLIHSTSYAHPSSRIGDGCLVYPLCNIGEGVEIERGAVLNNSVVVSHGSHIGAMTYLSPGVVLSGNVVIGAEAFVGAGVVVANGKSVGARVRVGVGSVVTRDIPDDTSAIGNPMRLLTRPLRLE